MDGTSLFTGMVGFPESLERVNAEVTRAAEQQFAQQDLYKGKTDSWSYELRMQQSNQQINAMDFERVNRSIAATTIALPVVSKGLGVLGRVAGIGGEASAFESMSAEALVQSATRNRIFAEATLTRELEGGGSWLMTEEQFNLYAPSTGGAAASEGLGGAAADSRAVWSSSRGDVIVEGTSLPGRTGMAVPRRMTTAEMSALQQSHDADFALIYELGPGKGGGGGRYMLYSGEHARVWFPPSGNQIWISHSHPSGYALRASADDQLWLQLMQRNGSPQRYSTVVPVDNNPFRFSATQARLGGN